jgi:ribosomal protein L37AE/L43A
MAEKLEALLTDEERVLNLLCGVWEAGNLTKKNSHTPVEILKKVMTDQLIPLIREATIKEFCFDENGNDSRDLCTKCKENIREAVFKEVGLCDKCVDKVRCGVYADIVNSEDGDVLKEQGFEFSIRITKCPDFPALKSELPDCGKEKRR